MHDPFSMRPFFGYNFGDYLQHWLNMGKLLKNPPKFFMVNWFRKGQNGGLLWPGFGDNIRVIQWILGRCDGVIPASGRPIGWVPTREELELLDIEGCEDIHELLSTPTSFWREEVESMKTYFTQQVVNIYSNVITHLFLDFRQPSGRDVEPAQQSGKENFSLR